MSQPGKTFSRSLADDVAGLAAARLEGERRAMAVRLAHACLAGLPESDIAGTDAETAWGMVMGLLSFLRERPTGAIKVRAFNPEPDLHGWTSSHSVVETLVADMPFIVDSVSAELARTGLSVHQLIHPILPVRRDGKGRLTGLADCEAAPEIPRESLMHVEIDRQDAEALKAIEARVGRVLADVALAVRDWQPMRARLREASAGMAGAECVRPPEECREAQAFLDWLHDDHFILLGYRCFEFSPVADDGAPGVSFEADLGLGILSDSGARMLDENTRLAEMPPEVRAFVTSPEVLLVTKSARHATVHRPAHMDVVGVKRFDETGRAFGMHAFIGLYTSAAYTRSLADIPLLRRKATQIMARAGFPPFSHDAKALKTILETYPRDELLLARGDVLFDTAIGILRLLQRPRTALFVRKDEFERFVSCLVFVPRDRFDTPLRLAIQRLLEEAWGGGIDAYYTQVADLPLARLHVIVRTTPGTVPDVDVAALERRIADAARAWTDQLQSALIEAHGESAGLALARRYAEAFPSSYRERYGVAAALGDVVRVETALAGGDIGLSLYRPIEAGEDEIRLKLYHPGQPLPLSDVLPMLENMGLHVIAEHPHQLHPAGTAAPVWIHDFTARSPDGRPILLEGIHGAFEEALAMVWRGESENDGFNRLVMRAGLDAHRVTVLRAYAKYLRQAGIPYSQPYLEEALAANPAIAAMLADLFLAMFDPDKGGAGADETTAAIAAALDSVANADEDRILRRFLGLIRATLRTNYFRPGRECLSFKLDSRAIEDLPLPRPMVEIFVYSPRVEAIHLRGGKVARGGIRWSDRREDFRTEILGLMKAQMVKNAVIVPVGAKGGFVVKRPPAQGGREALVAEGIACYRIMMRGLLELTDNLSGLEAVPPERVVRRDDPDPYLVVAADKGTAAFSDIANAISEERGFWLGDAFASGGSKGYDHKAMGITARGAWEAVRRHFRELGLDTQAQDFTVVGVGDMSGDVFGNAMLLSPHIRLVAAFNHSHVFVDPAPDPAVSFAERRRLFEQARSWPDYDPALISKGGGVFARSAKSIALSPQMSALLGIAAAQITPAELIRALLRAPVDLLFFGGIGTYVKASRESHAEIGDRANDSLRIDAREVRAKVVGEGANLAVSQLGRIEFALNGGRVNTDAIDNSAGVDTSDHEVNIKILMNGLVEAGEMTGKQRDRLLAEMTAEVAALVLRDNYLQTQAMSVMEAQAAESLDAHARFMRLLEKAGRLDRAIEYLPDDEALTERAAQRRGLTRPELAVLLAYAKIWLNEAVLASDLPDDPFLAEDLTRYFPQPLGERFPDAVAGHRLRREIVATTIVNSTVNRVGIVFAAEMMEATGRSAADVARAYIVAREAFGLREVWTAIEGLDGQVPSTVQIAMFGECNRLMERAVAWVLRCIEHPFKIRTAIEGLAPGVAALEAAIPGILPEEIAAAIAAREAQYQGEGVPTELARRVADIIVLASAADIVRIANRNSLGIEQAGGLYFAVGSRFGLGWLRVSAQGISIAGHWQKLAAAAAIEDLYGHQRDITAAIAAEAPGLPADEALAKWLARRRGAAERMDTLLAELRAAPRLDLAMLMVANRTLKALGEAVEGRPSV